jgi:tetratricopeptide (TPR) repeat protein
MLTMRASAWVQATVPLPRALHLRKSDLQIVLTQPCNISGMYTPQFPCWSLIGRIGPHGVPFEVGSYKTVIADSSGELFLGVNGNYYPDNTGKWVATLSAANSSLPDSADTHPESKWLEDILRAANNAVQSGEWDAALVSLHKALALGVKKTPYESFAINMLLGVVLVQKRDLAAAVPALQNAAASPYASAEQSEGWLRTSAIIEFQLKDYANAIALGQQALQYNPSDIELETVIDQSRHLQRPQ